MVFCQDERITHFMNLSPQTPSPGEPEQPVLRSSEETSTQPSPAFDALPAVPEQQPTPAAEDVSTQPASSFEPLAEETEPQPGSSSEVNESDASSLDEDEDFEPLQPVPSTSQPSHSGVFIRKGILLAVASALVIAVLLVVLLMVINRPKDPPTDWIASYTPPAGTSTTGKVLYYLHWTNQNGELKGQLHLAAIANGTPQSYIAPATGLYNRDNHIIYVVVTINGQADTLLGKINDANDTLNLNPAGVTSQTSQFVFHIGNANDFNVATKNLKSGSGKK